MDSYEWIIERFSTIIDEPLSSNFTDITSGVEFTVSIKNIKYLLYPFVINVKYNSALTENVSVLFAVCITNHLNPQNNKIIEKNLLFKPTKKTCQVETGLRQNIIGKPEKGWIHTNDYIQLSFRYHLLGNISEENNQEHRASSEYDDSGSEDDAYSFGEEEEESKKEEEEDINESDIFHDFYSFLINTKNDRKDGEKRTPDIKYKKCVFCFQYAIKNNHISVKLINKKKEDSEMNFCVCLVNQKMKYPSLFMRKKVNMKFNTGVLSDFQIKIDPEDLTDSDEGWIIDGCIKIHVKFFSENIYEDYLIKKNNVKFSHQITGRNNQHQIYPTTADDIKRERYSILGFGEKSLKSSFSHNNLRNVCGSSDDSDGENDIHNRLSNVPNNNTSNNNASNNNAPNSNAPNNNAPNNNAPYNNAPNNNTPNNNTPNNNAPNNNASNNDAPNNNAPNNNAPNNSASNNNAPNSNVPNNNAPNNNAPNNNAPNNNAPNNNAPNSNAPNNNAPYNNAPNNNVLKNRIPEGSIPIEIICDDNITYENISKNKKNSNVNNNSVPGNSISNNNGPKNRIPEGSIPIEIIFDDSITYGSVPRNENNQSINSQKDKNKYNYSHSQSNSFNEYNNKNNNYNSNNNSNTQNNQVFIPQDPYKVETGFVGLKNQGATCYMNSVLQSLFHILRFRKILYAMPTNANESTNNKSVPYCLQRLFAKLQFSNSACSTKELTKSFGWDDDQTAIQHDAQEFCRILIDNLENKMKEIRGLEGEIPRLFRGKYKSFIRCKNVHFESAKIEDFYDLSMAVENTPNLSASFDKYIETELLSGENQYKTDQYGPQDALMGIEFIELPPVLHLHLRRFKFNYQSNSMSKINDRFEFPEILDLNKYLAQNLDHPIENNIYDLYGVLVHSGSVSAGHYFAFLRTSTDHQWFKFDDSSVSKVSAETAVQDNYGGISSSSGFNGYSYQNYFNTHEKSYSAYMLVYIRRQDVFWVMRPINEASIPKCLLLYGKSDVDNSSIPESFKINLYLSDGIWINTFMGIKGFRSPLVLKAVRSNGTTTNKRIYQIASNVFKLKFGEMRIWVCDKNGFPKKVLTGIDVVTITTEVDLMVQRRGTLLPLDISLEFVLVYIKLFNTAFKPPFQFIGYLYLPRKNRLSSLVKVINRWIGMPPETEYLLFEEKENFDLVQIKDINTRIPTHNSDRTRVNVKFYVFQLKNNEKMINFKPVSLKGFIRKLFFLSFHGLIKKPKRKQRPTNLSAINGVPGNNVSGYNFFGNASKKNRLPFNFVIGNFASKKIAPINFDSRNVSPRKIASKSIISKNASSRNVISRNVASGNIPLKSIASGKVTLKNVPPRNAYPRNFSQNNKSCIPFWNAAFRNAAFRNAAFRNAAFRNAAFKNAAIKNAAIKNAAIKNAANRYFANIKGVPINSADYKRIVTYCEIAEYRRIADYKRIIEYEKMTDFNGISNYNEIIEYERMADYNRNTDLKRVSDFRRIADYKLFANYKRFANNKRYSRNENHFNKENYSNKARFAASRKSKDASNLHDRLILPTFCYIGINESPPERADSWVREEKYTIKSVIYSYRNLKPLCKFRFRTDIHIDKFKEFATKALKIDYNPKKNSFLVFNQDPVTNDISPLPIRMHFETSTLTTQNISQDRHNPLFIHFVNLPERIIGKFRFIRVYLSVDGFNISKIDVLIEPKQNAKYSYIIDDLINLPIWETKVQPLAEKNLRVSAISHQTFSGIINRSDEKKLDDNISSLRVDIIPLHQRAENLEEGDIVIPVVHIMYPYCKLGIPFFVKFPKSETVGLAKIRIKFLMKITAFDFNFLDLFFGEGGSAGGTEGRKYLQDSQYLADEFRKLNPNPLNALFVQRSFAKKGEKTRHSSSVKIFN